jgi:DNA-binding LytR/AlgR family response regulator
MRKDRLGANNRSARGRGELTLANGLKVPVSRAYAAAVRDTDWAA